MLKNQFFYFSIIVFFSVFFSCTQNILASDLQGISNLKFEQRTWKSGNVGFHISGTLTGAASDDYHNNTFTKVQIRYVYDPDSKNVDLNTTDYKAGTRISQDDGNDSSFPVQKYAYTEYETVCVVNENKVEKGQSGYDNFYCESLDRNLIPGVYEFQIGGSGITTWNSYINNSYFKIEGVADTDTKPISFSFGSLSAVTAHQMDAKTTGGGWDFSITVQIGDVAQAYPMYLELGAATQIGSTAKYDCTPLSQYVSAKQTIGPFTGSKSFGFPFTSIPDNNYCISLKIDFGISIGSISIPIVATGGQSIDKNGFLIDKGSIIHIGNAVPLDPNATNDPEANDLGCKYEKDNKSYCLLAPLPGVGDATGKLDVTKGMGDYFNMIIKIVMGIIGVLAVLMVIVGGIEYMSTVNIGEKEGALARIGSALLGLLLALSAYLILKAVNPDLVNVNIGVPEGTIEGEEGTFEPMAGTGIEEPAEGGSPTPGITNTDKNKYDAEIKSIAAEKGVDWVLVKAIMAQESHFQPTRKDGTIIRSDIKNTKTGEITHAYGLMQLMPATFKQYGGTGDYTDPKNITGNIRAGVGYLAYLKDHACPGGPSDCKTSDIRFIAAAYNGGVGSSKVGSKGANSPSSRCPGKTAWACEKNWDKSNPNSFWQTYKYANIIVANYNAFKQ